MFRDLETAALVNEATRRMQKHAEAIERKDAIVGLKINLKTKVQLKFKKNKHVDLK